MGNFLSHNFTKNCSSYKERGVLTCCVSDTPTDTALHIMQVTFQDLSVSTWKCRNVCPYGCPNFCYDGRVKQSYERQRQRYV